MSYWSTTKYLIATTLLWSTCAEAQLLGNVGIEWEPVATADVDGDGFPDIVMRRKEDGLIGVWFFKGSEFQRWEDRGKIEAPWRPVGKGDFDKNGREDLLWYRGDSGFFYLQLMSMGLKIPPPPPTPQIVDMTAAVWLNPYGSGTPAGFRMDGSGIGVPQNGSIHYLVTPGQSLLGIKAIKFTLEVAGDDTIVPFQGNDPAPAKVRLFIGTSDLTIAHLRFWSDEWIKVGAGFDAAHPQSPGTGVHEITVPLDGALWHTVDGTKDPSAFNALLAHPQWIGHTYGGQFSDGHGIRGITPGNVLRLKAYHLILK